MLIEIELGQKEILNELELSALEVLGMNLANGHHFIFSNRDNLRRLQNIEALPSRVRAAFGQCEAKFAQWFGLISRVSRRCVADANCFAVQDGGDGLWRVPLERFADPGFLERPVLLGENRNDARFFRALGASYNQLLSNGALHLSLMELGGGGDTMWDNLDALRENSKFFLCIADSDRDTPDDPIGQTARRCREVLPVDLWHGSLLVMNCRTIENLALVELYKNQPWGRDRAGLVEVHEKLQRVSVELHRFGRMKESTALCRYKSPARPEEMEFYRESVAALSEGCAGICGDRPCVTIGPLRGVVPVLIDQINSNLARSGVLIGAYEHVQSLARVVCEFFLATRPLRA